VGGSELKALEADAGFLTQRNPLRLANKSRGFKRGVAVGTTQTPTLKIKIGKNSFYK
jgi:hypothetical protein